MSNNLCFFDKEGNYINFKYDDISQTYNGDLIFHENSSDTFKTIGLYMFERIPSFEFESQSLELEKFQLFNEYGINFTGNKYINQQFYSIEAVNNDPNFYSKWIYGSNFESKFPIGSEIIFDNSIFEFTNNLKSYTVVSSKKGAIMILSTMDNRTFNLNYEIYTGLTSSYENKTIRGINAIGIKDYVDYQSLDENLSSWSEPAFFDLLYNGRKLNIVNTIRNDGVVTVKNKDIFDKVYSQYYLNSIDLPTNSDLIMEVVLKTDLPIIYKGGVNILSDRIQFSGIIPKVLKPGSQITFSNSLNGNSIVDISYIPTFLGNTQLTFYATASQVIWENQIYQCVQAYTQSATSSINPSTASYWTNNITYLPVDDLLTPESLLYSEVYLTTNKLYYGVSASDSGLTHSELVLAFAGEKYKSDFLFLNIDLKYESRTLKSNLNYSSEYANVNFYHTKIGETYSIGQKRVVYEKTIETIENLSSEFNIDISERNSYNIVFTDIDEYGITIEINGMLYQQEVQWVYSGLNIDMTRTIDKTLRYWLILHSPTLYRLGISCNLDYLVNYPYIYFDSIILRTVYPNIPIEFKVLVGTTANYYIQHSSVVFYEIGNSLSIIINNRRYDIPFNTDVTSTLIDWINTYSETLDDYKIYVSSKNNILFFNIKEYDKVVDYSISIGKSILPGYEHIKISNRIKGNIGPIITSNAATLLTSTHSSFFDVNGASAGDVGFATGMVASINNTIYPFDNQEYNLIEVNTDRIVFSYQGPFWGSTPSLYGSPFTNIAFDNGFSQSMISNGTSSSTALGGFNSEEFDYSFNIFTETDGVYTSQLISSISNLSDILYIGSSEQMYALGDVIQIFDGLSGDYYDTINLPGLSQSLKLIFNNIDGYLYALTTTLLYKIEPSTNFIVDIFTYSIPYIPHDCIINDSNGDLYISYSEYSYIDIIDISGSRHGLTSSIVGLTSGTYKLAYNQFEDDIYVTTGSNEVLRINGSDRSEFTSYTIPGLTNSIVYNPDGSSIYVMGSNLYKIDNGLTNSISVIGYTFSDIIYNNISQQINVSTVGFYSGVNPDNSISYTLGSIEYGSLSINQYDECIYLSSINTNDVIIIDSSNGSVKNTLGMSASVSKLTYNPVRKSMWGILPDINKLIEISVELSTYLIANTQSYNGIYDSQYGTLNKDYQPRPSIWIKTRDYIRKPRENFEGDNEVKYIWKWLTDDVPSIFMYDISGKQLSESGPYAYIGEKPLSNINLNRSPNKEIGKTASSSHQQTIFTEISEKLDYINSSTNVSYMPEPIELFLGFNSIDEGVSKSTLLLYKRESVSFSIISNSTNLNKIVFERVNTSLGTSYGRIILDTNSTDNFIYDSFGNNRGLKIDQEIQIFIKDNTNTKNKYISFNNGIKVKITSIFLRTIIVKFINSVFTDESTVILDYPKSGQITYMTTTIKTTDKEIGRFAVTGQTEIEDIRYKTELTNSGKNITANDIFIFKTYDINEQGVDWGFLNKKRKEMLFVKDDIYPYVGSYKAIINAINYFGYNDLELYEYYRNINIESKDLGKLYKVEIPDIFDNTVAGWTENDFIKHTMPNKNYEDTNLFNLTYRITDVDGNNVLLYSLPEVLIKLQGLKYWIQRNVIPLSHKILDITGRADFPAPSSISHYNYDVTIFNVKQSLSPIDFNINEAYLMPVNSGSTVYNVVIDFNNQFVDVATRYFSVNEIPDYFDLKIRTYKTYPEWRPFKTYTSGNIVSYYDTIYESVFISESGNDSNRLNDPRKYQSTSTWNVNIDYKQGDIVEYKRSFYEFLGTQSALISGTSSVRNPFTDVLNNSGNWIDITEWRKLDYKPVQTFTEFRTGTHSYNFTVDTNIDPFITIEVTSDNGYGQIYTSKKNYELRSLLDIDEGLGELDDIEPIKIYNFLTSTTTTTTTQPTVIVYDWEPIDGICEDDGLSQTTTTTTTTTTTSTTTTTTTAELCCSPIVTFAAVTTPSSTIGITIDIDNTGCGECNDIILGYSSDDINYNYVNIGCVVTYNLLQSNAQSWYFRVAKICNTVQSPFSTSYFFAGRTLDCVLTGTASVISVGSNWGVDLTRVGNQLTAAVDNVGPYRYNFYAVVNGSCNNITFGSAIQTTSNVNATTSVSYTLYASVTYTFYCRVTDLGTGETKVSNPVGPFGCLVPETLITLLDGSQSEIKDINIGDFLLGMTDNGSITNGIVVGKSTHYVDEVYDINGLIKASDSHLHVTRNGDEFRLLRTIELKIGDNLVSQNGDDILITSINRITGRQEVINISTDIGTYIANGLFTHNKSECV